MLHLERPSYFQFDMHALSRKLRSWDLFGHAHPKRENHETMVRMFPLFPLLMISGWQDANAPIGWPLGLEAMNTRLRVADSLSAAAGLPQSMHVPSTSFSSFSSSNLDTASTASFFQDHSKTLGRLIGIKPKGTGGFSFPNAMEERETISITFVDSNARRRREMCWGICICIPLPSGVMVKMSTNKRKSKR